MNVRNEGKDDGEGKKTNKKTKPYSLPFFLPSPLDYELSQRFRHQDKFARLVPRLR